MKGLVILGLALIVAFAGCQRDDGPTPPVPTGSCCTVSGSCTVTTVAVCTGTWTQARVCEPNPCTQPVGACCALSGTCAVVTQADCALPGAWTALATCEPNPCPQAPPPDMVLIPAGMFTMGSPEGEPGRHPAEIETQHQVTLTRAFYICSHEVTQAEWHVVMEARPSYFAGDDRPVEQVSWFDCVEYCNRRSMRENLDSVYTLRSVERSGGHITNAIVLWDREAGGYRLPTESEWEYACRAGTTTAFSNGQITAGGYDCAVDRVLDLVGWYCSNSSDSTHAVGGKAANAWGLTDMHGNVREWCWDRFGNYPTGAVLDPAGPSWGDYRILRGGSYRSIVRNCRSADRAFGGPTDGGAIIGLRVVMAVP